MQAVVQGWLECITLEYEFDTWFLDELCDWFRPIPVISFGTIEDRLIEHIDNVYNLESWVLPEIRQITRHWLETSLSRRSDGDSAVIVNKGVLRCLPKHIICALWPTSETWTCGVCLDQIASIDDLAIIVCCGNAYCKGCFPKMDSCGYCRAKVI